jgi:hypothetical protein
MTERERLIEMLRQGQKEHSERCQAEIAKMLSEKHHYNSATDRSQSLWEALADHLLANGVIVPPCKVGDTVYTMPPCWREKDGVSAYQITNLMISCSKKGIWTKKYRAMWFVNGKTVDAQMNFCIDDIGKTVFLTKEEAEKALERSRG